jgi:hypothetical protein
MLPSLKSSTRQRPRRSGHPVVDGLSSGSASTVREIEAAEIVDPVAAQQDW